MKKRRLCLNGLLLLLIASCGAARQPGPAQSGLERYLTHARTLAVDDRQGRGSLWTEGSSLSDGIRDVKARRVSDIVTIEVVETTSATAEARTDTSKKSDGTRAIPNLFGLEGRIAELPKLVDSSHESTFKGDASTRRSSTLRTSISAMVVETLPNGYLIVEGNREVLINNERQLVTVRGIVRPQDISPANTVLSTSVAELEIEVDGRGIVAKAQKQGVLSKILSGIWPF
ncbi:MAG: flagellar basal body L-ring protein FlgH [Acidobacteriota bacterium]